MNDSYYGVSTKNYYGVTTGLDGKPKIFNTLLSWNPVSEQFDVVESDKDTFLVGLRNYSKEYVKTRLGVTKEAAIKNWRAVQLQNAKMHLEQANKFFALAEKEVEL